MYSADEPAQGRRHPLARGASPEAIVAALLPEDRSAFLTEYAAALAQVFRHIARRAVQLLTGQPSPEDEPLAVTRQKAGGI